MTPEEAVCNVLALFPAVTAIVSDRIYVDKAPQAGTFPLIVVQLASEQTFYHLRGGWRGPARVQVDQYVQESGDAYRTVTDLAQAVNGADDATGLSGWSGEVDGSPPFRISGILRIDRVRKYDADELRLLRQGQDYMVHFRY